MTPTQSAQHFLLATLMGLGLGLIYGFLRPLRPKHTHLSDFLFVIVLFWVWLQLNFGVCYGDIRLGGVDFGAAFATGLWLVLGFGRQNFLLYVPSGETFFEKNQNFFKFPLGKDKKSGYNKV